MYLINYKLLLHIVIILNNEYIRHNVVVYIDNIEVWYEIYSIMYMFA